MSCSAREGLKGPGQRYVGLLCSFLRIVVCAESTGSYGTVTQAGADPEGICGVQSTQHTHI